MAYVLIVDTQAESRQQLVRLLEALSKLPDVFRHRSAERYCSRATLDEPLPDEVMVPVMRSAPDEFREMMAEMAQRNLVRVASQPDPFHLVLGKPILRAVV